jgi:vacuolar-type H+-ATPase subunit I/STV1
MRRYRAEIVLLLCTLVLCFLAVRALSQETKASALKPGDEVKVTELESAKLGKLKAQLDRLQVQQALLQQQYNQLLAEAGRTQAKIDALAKDVEARIKREKKLEITYDQSAGEDGIFRIAPAPVEEKKTEAKKQP